MISLSRVSETGLSDEELLAAITESLSDETALKKVLILPPDITRFHSYAGQITKMYYDLLKDHCEVDILPAVGTHVAMSEEECAEMYPGIPFDRFLVHHWRDDVVQVGVVPREYVAEVSEGLMDEDIAVEVNRRVADPTYDLVLSVGQVVPHEVVGMANRTKNILVGCGGSAMINASHMLGAVFGMERIMGKDHSPVRQVLDYGADHFLADVPLCYVLTVTQADRGTVSLRGLYIGRDRSYFEQAVALSQQLNLTFVDQPFQRVVVNLDEKEFKSTWVGNKAIYRTRMAMADGGDLIILAGGVDRFGEDPSNDALIRKYGYAGRLSVLRLSEENADLAANRSAAAHLIHGSSDGRFTVTYCTRHLTQAEIEGVHFAYVPYDEAVARYDPAALVDGYNTLADGEVIYYISNPALGLWADRARF